MSSEDLDMRLNWIRGQIILREYQLSAVDLKPIFLVFYKLRIGWPDIFNETLDTVMRHKAPICVFPLCM